MRMKEHSPNTIRRHLPQAPYFSLPYSLHIPRQSASSNYPRHSFKLYCSSSSTNIRWSMVTSLVFLLFLLLHHSYGHDHDDKSCSRHYQQKKKMALWPWKKDGDGHVSRKAYRMAILASLAYNEFGDPHDGNNHVTNYNNTSWAFSLADDDPPPTQYLMEYDNEGSSTSLSWGKRRNKIQRVVAGIVARFRVSFCQARYKVARMVADKLRMSNPSLRANTTALHQCKQRLLQKHEGGKRYSVEWILNNWHEEKAKIRWVR